MNLEQQATGLGSGQRVDPTLRPSVRAFLRARRAGRDLGDRYTDSGLAEHRRWVRSLFEYGIAGVVWPAEYGGRGLGPAERAVVEEEYALAGAPEPINLVGVDLVAPALLAHADAEQRRSWLPALGRGDELWSLALSEPEAGSDLRGVRTSVRHDGDEVVVQGRKVWCSFAQWADWLFLLAAEPAQAVDARGRRGLTVIAVPTMAAGVTVTPITMLNGVPGFCEVLLDEVRVSSDCIIGMPGDGWSVVATVLRAERSSLMAPARFERRLAQLADLLDLAGIDRTHPSRAAMATLAVDTQTYRSFHRVLLGIVAAGRDPGALASVAKLHWSGLDQRIFETGMAALDDLGELAELSECGGFGAGVPPTWVEWVTDYWQSRATAIYGGADPIQRDVVARAAMRHQ